MTRNRRQERYDKIWAAYYANPGCGHFPCTPEKHEMGLCAWCGYLGGTHHAQCAGPRQQEPFQPTVYNGGTA